jgi:hypothetical protein
MPTTFNSSTSAYHNGSILKKEFTFANATTIEPDFNQLTIDVHDAATMDIIASTTVSRQDIEDYIGAIQNGDTTVPVTKYIPNLSTGSASKVKIYATENGKEGSDQVFTPVEVNILKAPSPPIVSLSNESFTKNTPGTGVVMSGDFKITPNISENVKFVQMIVIGIESGGVAFRYSSDKTAFEPSEATPSYIFNLGNSAFDNAEFKNLKPDSTVKFYAKCEANDYESALSAFESVNASIRLLAPVLSSAKSFQDKKVTVSGTIKQSSNETHKYSILAQKMQENVNLSPTGWLPTDNTNIAVPSQVGATAQTVSFSKDVTRVNGNILDLGEVYAFIAVQHSGNFELNKSVDISANANPPPLDQSVASSAKTAVTVAHFDKTLVFSAGSQSGGNATTPALSFTPVFRTSIGAAADLPTNDGILYDWYFSSAKKGQINKGHNASGISAIPSPNIFVDPTPIENDEYTFTATISYFVSSFAISKIEGTPDLTYSLHPQNGQNVVSLASFTTKSKKAKSSIDVPVLKNLDLGLTLVEGARKLTASYQSEFDKTVLTLNAVELQVMKGIAGTGDTGFNPLSFASSSSVTTYNAEKNSSTDIKDVIIFNDLYTVGATTPYDQLSSSNLSGVFTVRARCKYTDKDTNAPVDSAWVYDSYEVASSIMNAPKSVAIASVASTKGKSFSVTFVVAKKEEITGLPASWGSPSEPTLDSARVNLFNSDGKVITSYTYKFSAAENVTFSTADVTVDKLSPKEFTELELAAGEFVYAEVSIVYMKKDSTLTSVGAKNDRNITGSYEIVSPNIQVGDITLTQNPPLLTASGFRTVDNNGMTSLKISAKVDFGGLDRTEQGVVVKAIMAAVTGANNLYEHALTWDSPTEAFVSADITPNPKLNYKDALVLVIVTHPKSSNVTAYRILA